ncbi:MAG: electron transport complex subunit RsxC [Treponemataceae bacterium]|nr:electron transport complex subunit RsxC [Treponemataceae bacterium]
MGIMKKFTFKGGIHPPEMKELSKDKKIESAFPSTNSVCIPVTQGGAPNQSLVNPGDHVVRGQVIARSDAFMSAPVHASVSGTVKKIENRLVTANVDAPCIVIQADGSDSTSFLPPLDPFSCTKEEALARVREAGIVGMGGAAFPTHVKLNPPADKKIDYVLANAAECEPYLTIDYRTMIESADKFIDGLAIAVKITGAEYGIIVLEDNKMDLVEPLSAEIKKHSMADKLSIRVCKSKYPQGGEKNIIKAAVGREIPVRGLPADAGCVVDNVGTLVAISEAFREGKPLIDRSFTVSGLSCENPCNLKVPVGTLVGDLIPEVVQLKPGVVKIISGGPMMGFSMMNANFPVQKNTSGVLFLTKKEAPSYEESPCIGCGRCVKICSCRLAPVLINRALIAGNMEDAKKFGLMDCVDCGTCAWVCPSHVKLVQRFRVGKGIVREEMAKAKAAAQAAANAAATKAAPAQNEAPKTSEASKGEKNGSSI